VASILWLIKGTKELEPRFASFADKLKVAGYQIRFLGIPEENHSFDWLNQNISHDERFLFFSEPEMGWLRRMTDNMGLLSACPSRVIAWIHETITEQQLELLDASGIDEVFCVTENSAAVAPRLQLRAFRNYQISELKRNVRELQKKDARSETILTQREEFLSICAHDLRSPLGLIQSSLSLALSDKNQFSSQQVELLERSKRQAEHGIRLVNDLLDVMAYEQGLKPDYQLVDLEIFLQNLFQDYAFVAKQKGIELKYENPLAGWTVLIDPDRIHQLLQNLLQNAIKFTETGRKISLSVFSFKGRRKQDPPFPMVIVSVRDEGRGIPEEEVKKLFNRFSQIKDYSRMEGRGLGLTVAKQISNLHDGNLWVKSVEGEGSTFFVLFPHVLSEPKKLEKWKSSQNRPKVLIAEPDKSNQEVFSNLMERWEFEPVFAKNGIELVTYGYFHQPQAILVGAELTKLTEHEAIQMLKTNPKTERLPIFLCRPAGSVTSPEKKKLLVDGTLKLPLDRASFQVALEAYQSKMKKFRKVAA